MHTSCTNRDAVTREQTFFNIELLKCGTVYLTVSVLRVCLLLSTLSVLLIFGWKNVYRFLFSLFSFTGGCECFLLRALLSGSCCVLSRYMSCCISWANKDDDDDDDATLHWHTNPNPNLNPDPNPRHWRQWGRWINRQHCSGVVLIRWYWTFGSVLKFAVSLSSNRTSNTYTHTYTILCVSDSEIA